jgi:ribosomal protein S13
LYKCGNTYSDKVCSYEAKEIELKPTNGGRGWSDAERRITQENIVKDTHEKRLELVRKEVSEKYRLKRELDQIRKDSIKRQKKHKEIITCIFNDACRLTP